MNPIIFALALALGLATLSFHESIECWLEPGTDSCVGCTDDCLEMEDN